MRSSSPAFWRYWSRFITSRGHPVERRTTDLAPLMRTIRLEEPGHLTLLATEAPNSPQAGEALVRVHRAGVCGTDIHAFGGKQPFFSYPRILGHELGVEVLEVGPGVEDVRA